MTAPLQSSGNCLLNRKFLTVAVPTVIMRVACKTVIFIFRSG